MRKYSLLFIGFCLAGVASAGEIQIGGLSGLSSAYTGINVSNERAYTSTLFAFATTITSPSSALPTGTTTAGANQLVDPNNGIQFNTIAGDSATNCALTGTGLCDYLAVSGSTTLITVPVGLNEIDQVWTLINDYWGLSGDQAKVIFNFGTTATVANLASQTVTLTEGNQYDDALDCSAAGTSTPNCTNFITSTSSANTSVAWSAASYTAPTSGTGPYVGTSGSLSLSDQSFTLTPTANYLVSITIEDLNGASNVSKLALSAITVDQAASSQSAIPEPSTVLLLLGGLVVMAAIHLRRRLVA
jgi:hypothetical protein